MEELDLRELFSLFWNKRIKIVLIVLIFIVLGIIYSYFYIVPNYTAVTSLVLVQSSSQSGETSINSTDLSMNSKLVSTYSAIIKKNIVLGQVASNLNLDKNEIEKIKNNVSVASVDDTEIIEIKVKNESPEYATTLANEIAKVFSEKIVEIFNISNIYILDEAEVPTTPSNINHIKDILVFAIIGFIVSAISVLISNMLDNTIKTEEDIEKGTGLFVLASIPNYREEFKIQKGGKKKR